MIIHFYQEKIINETKKGDEDRRFHQRCGCKKKVKQQSDKIYQHFRQGYLTLHIPANCVIKDFNVLN